jgi:hypothetical protein
MELEAGIKFWASSENPIPVTLWPEEPPESGGLCIFEGPMRQLTQELAGRPIKAVVTAIPRPNQAYWSLSALWSGWLWGHLAVGPFKAVLRRRRYDWQWHAEALKALFDNLAEVLPVNSTPFLGLLAEPEPPFISAVFLAARAAGLEISGLAVRGGLDPVQILWKKGKQTAATRKKTALALDVNYTRKLIREILVVNNEPLDYLRLHTFLVAALLKKEMFFWSEDALIGLGKNIHAALSTPEFVDVEDRSSPETGRWALEKWTHQTSFHGIE